MNAINTLEGGRAAPSLGRSPPQNGARPGARARRPRGPSGNNMAAPRPLPAAPPPHCWPRPFRVTTPLARDLPAREVAQLKRSGGERWGPSVNV